MSVHGNTSVCMHTHVCTYKQTCVCVCVCVFTHMHANVCTCAKCMCMHKQVCAHPIDRVKPITDSRILLSVIGKLWKASPVHFLTDPVHCHVSGSFVSCVSASFSIILSWTSLVGNLFNYPLALSLTLIPFFHFTGDNQHTARWAKLPSPLTLMKGHIHCVGISETCNHIMPHKVLTDNMHKVIFI